MSPDRRSRALCRGRGMHPFELRPWGRAAVVQDGKSTPSRCRHGRLRYSDHPTVAGVPRPVTVVKMGRVSSYRDRGPATGHGGLNASVTLRVRLMNRESLESLLPTPVTYASYLLRTWRTAAGGVSHWMIENVMTGDRHTFAELPDLVIFLRDHAGETSTGQRSCSQPRHRSVRRATPPTSTADLAEDQP